MTSRFRWLLFSLPLLGFAALVYVFGSAIGTDSSLLPSTRIDKPVPAFDLPLLDNPQKKVTQEVLKGPVILNVWATWCPTCQEEHPLLVQLARNGIPIIGVNYKDEPQAALKYLEIHGNPFKLNIADEKGSFGLDLGVYGAPESYLIDAEGRIQYRQVGAITPDVWRNVLWPKWKAMGGTYKPAQDDKMAAGASS